MLLIKSDLGVSEESFIPVSLEMATSVAEIFNKVM